MDKNLPDYNWVCPHCEGQWIVQYISHIREVNSIRSLKVIVSNNKYDIRVNHYDNTYYEIRKESRVTFCCGCCERELSQEDLMKLAFDTNL